MQTHLEVPIILPIDANCETCTNRLRESLLKVKGVTGAQLVPDGTTYMKVDYDPNLISFGFIEDEAKRIGLELTKRFHHENLDLTGLDCADCALTIEKSVSRMDGVIWSSVNYPSSKMQVEYEADKVNQSDIISQIKGLGYGVKKGFKPLVKGEEFVKSVFYIPEMDCDEEIALIRKKVGSMNGVKDIEFNLMSRKVIVVHRLSEGEIAGAIRDIKMTPQKEEIQEEKELSFWDKNKKIILTLISGIFTGGGFTLSLLDFPQTITVPLFVIAMVAGGWFVARKGFVALQNMALDMNFLMTIAVVGAALIGEWTEGAMVIFLFSVANLLESFSMDRARNAIRSLMDLSPNTATVKRDGEEIELPVEEIKVGDVVLVKPGEKIPLDGLVKKGSSSVNQAPITGESMPVEKTLGDEVYAGTINEKGYLEVEVSRLSKDTTLSKIIHLVEEAQAQKAPSQNFVDRFAKYYTPSVIAVAALLAILPPLIGGGAWGVWFYRSLVLLVVACPCALVISTPVTVVSGLARAAKSGILIKGGVHLENAGSLKAVAFDKTGTLTKGKPEVTDLISLNSRSKEEVLRIAASIESRSEHHLGGAILAYAGEKNVGIDECEDFESITGMGARAKVNGDVYYIGSHRLFEENGWCNAEVDARLSELERSGKTAVMLGNENGIMGIIGIADEVRDRAIETISQLKKNGIEKTVMLTGDNRATAEAIAGRVGIDEYRAELLPEDKVKTVKDLLEKYGKTAMVGDGINDAPALAAATIGIAMGTAGTDTALETADIALMGDDLSKLPLAMRLSRKALAIIKENITFALILKAVFIALTPLGLTTLWMAVGADMGASLLVIFNGLRVLRKRDS